LHFCLRRNASTTAYDAKNKDQKSLCTKEHKAFQKKLAIMNQEGASEQAINDFKAAKKEEKSAQIKKTEEKKKLKDLTAAAELHSEKESSTPKTASLVQRSARPLRDPHRKSI
jgi:hypothetical protein